MTEPTVEPFTRRVYDRLPELYRDADAPDRQLLRFLSLVGDQAGALERLFDRIDYTPPDEGGAPGGTSDLTDPATADPAWLPWLAQLVGVTLNPALPIPAQRNAISGAVAGWQAGTRDAIAAAARTALVSLTGPPSVVVRPHPTDPWTLRITTIPEETPDADAVIAAIIAANAKPAGVLLVHTFYAPPWELIEAELPDWQAIEDADTWSAIESLV